MQDGANKIFRHNLCHTVWDLFRGMSDCVMNVWCIVALQNTCRDMSLSHLSAALSCFENVEKPKKPLWPWHLFNYYKMALCMDGSLHEWKPLMLSNWFRWTNHLIDWFIFNLSLLCNNDQFDLNHVTHPATFRSKTHADTLKTLWVWAPFFVYPRNLHLRVAGSHWGSCLMRSILEWERKNWPVCKSFNFQDLYLRFFLPPNHPTPTTPGCLYVPMCVCICVCLRGRGIHTCGFGKSSRAGHMLLELLSAWQRWCQGWNVFVFFLPLSHSEECRQVWLGVCHYSQIEINLITDVSDIWLLCVISYDRGLSSAELENIWWH